MLDEVQASGVFVEIATDGLYECAVNGRTESISAFLQNGSGARGIWRRNLPEHKVWCHMGCICSAKEIHIQTTPFIRVITRPVIHEGEWLAH